MRAGLMRRQLDVQKPVEVKVSGEVTVQFRTDHRRRFRIRPLSGRELYESDKPRGDIDAEGQTRVHPSHTLSPKWRLVDGDETWEIVNVIPDEKRRNLKCLLRRVVA